MRTFWCRLGLHRWQPALGHCEDCGLIDKILRPEDFRSMKASCNMITLAQRLTDKDVRDMRDYLDALLRSRNP